MKTAAICFALVLACCGPVFAENSYVWLGARSLSKTILTEVSPPSGFRRTILTPGTFADWLRNFPLKPAGSRVLLFDGRPKQNQLPVYTVLDLDTGTKDLQQCADAVIRLRGEYLFAAGRNREISFNFTSGDQARFEEWAQGMRPVVQGSKVRWPKQALADYSYQNFRRYLEKVMQFAGTYSLSRELEPVPLSALEPGDVFIDAGFPGHAVIVMDTAEDAAGRKIFLLAQSYMPAQDMHVLNNLSNAELSPWFKVSTGQPLETPEWSFQRALLYRFR